MALRPFTPCLSIGCRINSMKKLSLSSILLFILLVPFIMTFRISPGDTPYWLFGIIFFGLFVYSGIDLIKIKEEAYYNFKQILLWVLILATIGSAFYSAILVRHKTAPEYNVHDIILQQEAAIRFFLDKKNPYSTPYFGTPLERWHYSDTEVNPALYHFVMEPFYLLSVLPFYYVSVHTVGFFDGRILLYLLFLSTLILGNFLIKDKEKKLLFLTLMAFNPAMLSYTLEGRSDMFMFAFLFASLYLLQKGKYVLAGIPMALAFTVKQSVWPILPLYVAYLYFKEKSIRKVFIDLSLFLALSLIIVLPFFVWDPKAFMDSTVYYLSGSTKFSYPIAGYGWGMVLLSLGIINNTHQNYPFMIWQAIFSIPLLIVLLVKLKEKTTVNRLIIFYGLFLFVFWYFSRYLNNSHLGYLSVVFLTAYFWPQEEESSKTK